MEPSSAAWADAHRQLAQCCVGPDGACHPEAGCNANQNDCETSGGQLKCNRSGSFKFGEEGTVSPPNPGAGQCCLDSNGACHPEAGCNDSQKDCESSKGKLKCNLSGGYQWGDTGSPPPPPAPTNAPSPNPVSSTVQMRCDTYVMILLFAVPVPSTIVALTYFCVLPCALLDK